VSTRAPPAFGRGVDYVLLYRLTLDGHVVPTWPGAAPTREVELGVDIPRLEQPFSAATAIASMRGLLTVRGQLQVQDGGSARAFVGHDDRTYLCDAAWIARVTRGGASA